LFIQVPEVIYSGAKGAHSGARGTRDAYSGTRGRLLHLRSRRETGFLFRYSSDKAHNSTLLGSRRH
jgi:hypothetical protein